MKARTLFGPAALVASAVTIGQLNAGDSSRSGGGGGGVAGLIGPDVLYSGMDDGVDEYAPVGGIRAYALGSNTCNIGDQNLLWLNDGTPGLAMNAYRLHNGRFMQIGMSWVKTACCAAASPFCGMTCNGASGSVLGAGCRDTYWAGWNGIQGNLSPRSGINGFTGTFSPIPPGGVFSSIDRRLQVAESDMSTTTYPGALYFVEGQYVGTDDAAAGNEANNASYQRVLVSPTFAYNVTDTFQVDKLAIQAWKANGLGLGVPDPAITIQDAYVPGEGRFVVGSRVKDNGDGTWTYDYAIYNFNSNRAGGSLSIPVAGLVNVTGVGFNDVNYHSGEPFDNTNWNWSETSSQLTWSSPQTFAVNPNSNALRWGTMYTFWFTADVGPAAKTSGATLGLFKPGTPDSIALNVPVPANPADLDGDGLVTGIDLALLLGDWGRCSAGAPGGCPADLDGDGIAGGLDLALLLGEWS